MNQIAAAITLQSQFVVTSAAPGSIAQPREGWVDVAAFHTLIVFVRAPIITNARVTLQTSLTEDGSAFVTVGGLTWTSPTTTTAVCPPSATTPLGRWLRWHVQALAPTAIAQFEMHLLLRGRSAAHLSANHTQRGGMQYGPP